MAHPMSLLVHLCLPVVGTQAIWGGHPLNRIPVVKAINIFGNQVTGAQLSAEELGFQWVIFGQ